MVIPVAIVLMLFAPRYIRVVVSYTAAAAAACTVAIRDHVHIAWRNPATWSNVLQHRCGQLMLVCAAWTLMELTVAMLLPRERDSMLQPMTAG
jgi:hypothetical protein